MSRSASSLTFKLENFELTNPLECLICGREFTFPVRLPCQHSFCKNCVESKSVCAICGGPVEGEFVQDTLLAYLIETSHEVADVCANCDQVSQPMHFCETCQQALCNECRQSTHQAKMFSSHRVVPLEERAKVKGKVTCPVHGEPFILYSVETKTLACIVCFNNAAVDSRHNLVSIDTAHNVGCEKLEAAAMKLRSFQEELYEQVELRKKLVDELDESHHSSCSNIRRMCQEMIDTIVMVREKLLKELNEEKSLRESHFNEQIRQLITLQPTIQLCLLGASIFCSSASKLDFLLFSADLIKRIQAILSMACEKPQYTGELSVNSREELGAALEPFLGLSTVLLSTGRPCAINGIIRKCGSVTSYQSSFGYANGSTPVSRKYQLVVDLAGAFGEQFSKIEVPLKQFSHDMAVLGKKVQETQRDLTLRKCVVEKNAVTDLTSMCFDLYSKLGQQSKLINELQPQLQQIWQEQLDRVRRQQILFREKVEETLTLRESAQHVANAARQLEPFAACLAAVTSVIDWRRCHRPELAPMESICLQINTIEPNSQHRIEAIQKEENNRRLALDQKKREEQMQFYAVKKHLKTTKEQRKLKREFLKDSMSRPRLVNTNRDRSPGGTDRALLSPCHRRSKGCSSVGSRSQSDVEEIESSMDDSFEFTAESSSAETETVKIEHHFCKSNPLRLSVPISVRSSHKEHKSSASTSLPDVDEISRRIAAASEIGVDNCQQLKNNEPRCNILKIPQVPYVPTTVFAGVTPDAPFRGTYECREKLLESLKQKVLRVDIGATFDANKDT